MKKYVALFCLVFSLTFNTYAGLVSEISTYFNVREGKIVTLVGELHINSPVNAAEQWSSWQEQISLLGKLDAKNFQPPIFLMEGSDDENSLFNGLPQLLTERGVLFKSPDVRAMVSQTLDRVRAGEKNLVTMNQLLRTLARPLLDMDRDEVLAPHKQGWEDTLTSIFKHVSDHPLFIQNNHKMDIPLDMLAQQVDSEKIADAIELIMAELLQAASSPEGEMMVDGFDLNSINLINKAPPRSAFVHVAGTAHKQHMELLLSKLGYDKIADHKKGESQASLDEFHRELNLVVTAKMGDNPDLTPELMQYIEKEATNLFLLKYQNRLSVEPEAFFQITKHFAKALPPR